MPKNLLRAFKQGSQNTESKTIIQTQPKVDANLKDNNKKRRNNFFKKLLLIPVIPALLNFMVPSYTLAKTNDIDNQYVAARDEAKKTVGNVERFLDDAYTYIHDAKRNSRDYVLSAARLKAILSRIRRIVDKLNPRDGLRNKYNKVRDEYEELYERAAAIDEAFRHYEEALKGKPPTKASLLEMDKALKDLERLLSVKGGKKRVITKKVLVGKKRVYKNVHSQKINLKEELNKINIPFFYKTYIPSVIKAIKSRKPLSAIKGTYGMIFGNANLERIYTAYWSSGRKEVIEVPIYKEVKEVVYEGGNREIIARMLYPYLPAYYVDKWKSASMSTSDLMNFLRGFDSRASTLLDTLTVDDDGIFDLYNVKHTTMPQLGTAEKVFLLKSIDPELLNNLEKAKLIAFSTALRGPLAIRLAAIEYLWPALDKQYNDPYLVNRAAEIVIGYANSIASQNAPHLATLYIEDVSKKIGAMRPNIRDVRASVIDEDMHVYTPAPWEKPFERFMYGYNPSIYANAQFRKSILANNIALAPSALLGASAENPLQPIFKSDAQIRQEIGRPLLRAGASPSSPTTYLPRTYLNESALKPARAYYPRGGLVLFSNVDGAFYGEWKGHEGSDGKRYSRTVSGNFHYEEDQKRGINISADSSVSDGYNATRLSEDFYNRGDTWQIGGAGNTERTSQRDIDEYGLYYESPFVDTSASYNKYKMRSAFSNPQPPQLREGVHFNANSEHFGLDADKYRSTFSDDKSKYGSGDNLAAIKTGKVGGSADIVVLGEAGASKVESIEENYPSSQTTSNEGMGFADAQYKVGGGLYYKGYNQQGGGADYSGRYYADIVARKSSNASRVDATFSDRQSFGAKAYLEGKDGGISAVGKRSDWKAGINYEHKGSENNGEFHVAHKPWFGGVSSDFKKGFDAYLGGEGKINGVAAYGQDADSKGAYLYLGEPALKYTGAYEQAGGWATFNGLAADRGELLTLYGWDEGHSMDVSGRVVLGKDINLEVGGNYFLPLHKRPNQALWLILYPSEMDWYVFASYNRAYTNIQPFLYINGSKPSSMDFFGILAGIDANAVLVQNVELAAGLNYNKYSRRDYGKDAILNTGNNFISGQALLTADYNGQRGAALRFEWGKESRNYSRITLPKADVLIMSGSRLSLLVQGAYTYNPNGRAYGGAIGFNWAGYKEKADFNGYWSLESTAGIIVPMPRTYDYIVSIRATVSIDALGSLVDRIIK